MEGMKDVKVGDFVVCIGDFYNHFELCNCYKVTFVNDKGYSVRTDFGSVFNFPYSIGFFRPATLLEKELVEL